MAKAASFSKPAQQARLAALQAKRAEIRAVSGPIRAARDEWWPDVHAKERDFHYRIVAAERGLYEIEVEINFLAKGLGVAADEAIQADIDAAKAAEAAEA